MSGRALEALRIGRTQVIASGDYRDRVRATVKAYLQILDTFPDQAQTLLVEIIGAGPRAVERRDRMLDEIADYLAEVNAREAEAGRVKRFDSAHDAFAIVGAVVELASRQIRTGRPADVRELEPVLERLVLGLLRSE